MFITQLTTCSHTQNKFLVIKYYCAFIWQNIFSTITQPPIYQFSLLFAGDIFAIILCLTYGGRRSVWKCCLQKFNIFAIIPCLTYGGWRSVWKWCLQKFKLFHFGSRFVNLHNKLHSIVCQLFSRGVPIIGSAIISATDMTKFVISIIGKYQKTISAEPISFKWINICSKINVVWCTII